MIEALERTWKEAGGTEVNHENISGDPVRIINRHLRNAVVECCYHASKFCNGSVEVFYPLSYNCVEKCTFQNWSVFSLHILKCQWISTSSLRTVASSQCEMYIMRYAEESPLSLLLLYDIPYILESNPHPNLIRTSFCRFLKRKKVIWCFFDRAS